MTREINLDVHLTTEGAVYTCLGIGALLAAALPRLLSRLPMSVELLVAEVLAPTDPVLASEVCVGEPSAEKRDEDEVRFALTSEAGLHDGLAALALAAAGNSRTGGWMVHWVWSDVLIRIAVGVAAGLATGFPLGRLLFRSPAKPLRLAEQGEGFARAC
ncbi:cation:proton antiporter domain-containing protein [Streptomyces parvus]|uniref:cation:proton antiporter domain-containing protein n=1 Tax=Streptomyces parvus TaxID=66428 RepID=UPI0033EDFB9F